MKAKVTNNSHALQGVWTAEDGLVFIEPGKTRTLHLLNERALALPFLKVEVLDGRESEPADGAAATSDEIAAAVANLDPATDEHWTAAGLPSVNAVAEAVGRAVTRAEIEAAASDARRPE